VTKTIADYAVTPGTRYRYAIKFHAWSESRTGQAYNWLRNRTQEFSHNLHSTAGQNDCFYIKDKALAMMFALTWGGRVG